MKRMIRVWIFLAVVTFSDVSSAGIFKYPAAKVYDIRFMEFAGREGHQGLFEARQTPNPGGAAIVRGRLLDAVQEVRLRLRDPSGNLILELPMLQSPAGNRIAGEYFVNFIVPVGPFKMSLAWKDTHGRSFEGSESRMRGISK